MTQIKRHIKAPDIVTGYILNPERGHWSVEVPTESLTDVTPGDQTNWITNPSAETDTTGWSSLGSSLTRTTTAWSGLYGIRVFSIAPVDGSYDQADLAAGIYRYSCKLYMFRSGSVIINISGSSISPIEFVARLAPQEWLDVVAPAPVVATATSTFTVSFEIQDYDASPLEIQQLTIDAQQLESGTQVSSYFDGDQDGCFWLGTPHASASVRTAQTTTGIPVAFDDLGFLVDAYTGTGMPTLDVQKTDYAVIDGAAYDGTRATERILAISGRFSGPTYQDVQRQRAAMIDAINRDRTVTDLPITLRYQAYRCNVPIGEPLRISAAYIGGLEGNVDNNYAEQCVIQFRCDDPFFYETITDGQAIDVNDTLSVDRIVRYNQYHQWSNLNGGPTNGEVKALARGLDGRIYVGGSFTVADGVANTQYLARWNESTGLWSSAGTFAAGTTGTPGVYAIVVAANGDLYIGGDFASVNGLANTKNIVRYRPSTGTFASIMTTGANNIVRALALDGTGLLYIGGDFTTINGVVINYLAQYNTGTGATGVVTATGPNNPVYSAACDVSSNLYIGGTFTTVNAVSALRIARWNRSAWSALGSGVSTVSVGATNVLAIACAPNGLVYAGGNFQVAGGVAVNYIAAWTGSAWQALGPATSPGLTSTSPQTVRAMSYYDGILYVGGFFTAAGTTTQVYRNIAMWTGYAWLRPDVEVPGLFGANVGALLAERQGLTIGHDESGTATVGVTTVVTSEATAAGRPTIKLTNAATVPIRLYQLLNITSGDSIYLDLIVLLGEQITLDLNARTITSNLRGNVTFAVLPGSNFATWRLVPRRDNYVNIYAEGAANGATLTINNPHWSVDGAVLR